MVHPYAIRPRAATSFVAILTLAATMLAAALAPAAATAAKRLNLKQH